MNEKLHGRLYNWKFGQALNYVQGEDERTVDLIHALISVFGTCPSFNGSLNLIIWHALESIGVKSE